MHTNYYFLRQLAPALEAHLTGLRFMECFSQDRDEVVLVFAQAKGKINYYKPFYLKASLKPEFSGLLFPESIQRARTNSVDLFGSLTDGFGRDIDQEHKDVLTDSNLAHQPGKAVLGVRSFLNERCLAIKLDGGYTLLFTFFGNRPNLLAFQENTVLEVFNHHLVSDQLLRLDTLDRPIDQSYTAFEQAHFDHRKLFPTFGKVVNAWLAEKQNTEINPLTGERKWVLIQDVLRQLEQPHYYLMRFDHKPTLSLLPWPPTATPANPLVDPPTEYSIREFSEPLEAANRLYIAYSGLSTFEHEKADLLRLLEKRRKRAQAQLDANLQRLIARDEGISHEEIGHIIMANLHNIPESPGARSPERITLYDFYREQPITIKLKPDLSPQKNAETYYRKAKNEQVEVDYLTGQITSREAELIRIEQQKANVEAIGVLKELRRYVKQNTLLNDQRGNGLEPGQAATAPIFKEIVVDDFRILVGRNAKNNDLLTQKYAHKEDLWLHARDVSGSHVVIKYRAGKPFPKNVVERAAELAAWYSKRRTDSLCPVTVTPKKFVRKPKGLAEGQVIVEKEDVVMVVPKGD